MGKPACRLGDIHSGHGCFPPTKAISGSGNVIINGKPALRVGDSFVSHGCPKIPPHGVKAGTGSSSVFTNSKPAVRIGDKTACGATMIVGSGNVLIGG